MRKCLSRYTNTKVKTLNVEGQSIPVRNWVDLYKTILLLLIAKTDQTSQALEPLLTLKGYSREYYFHFDREQIPSFRVEPLFKTKDDKILYVDTHSNTEGKLVKLRKVMEVLGVELEWGCEVSKINELDVLKSKVVELEQQLYDLKLEVETLRRMFIYRNNQEGGT